MSDRVAILRIERKALVELGEHAEFLREHPGDDSPEMAALDGSLDYDYFHAEWMDKLASDYVPRT